MMDLGAQIERGTAPHGVDGYSWTLAQATYGVVSEYRIAAAEADRKRRDSMREAVGNLNRGR